VLKKPKKTPTLKGTYMARRRGVIARLPNNVREMLNLKLQDGVTYGEISAWLETQGYAGVDKSQLRRWFQGGFADWVREQAELKRIGAREEFALNLVKGTDYTTFQEASFKMASAQFFEAFRQLDVVGLNEALKDKPELYVRMLNGLVRMAKGRIEMERFKRERGEDNIYSTTLTVDEQKRRMREILGMEPDPMLGGPEDEMQGGDGI
jgi:Protein of unknown function (DUF3486)